MLRRPLSMLAVATSLALASGAATGNAAQRGDRAAATLHVDGDTKLLVIAPHPDDETLAAGGLIARVTEMRGQVRVVFLTDGDAYREGVRLDEHANRPRPADYRDYGRRRQQEAREALRHLGLATGDLTFLSFPDRGLSRLLRTYWSERRAAFRSPYTRRDRPPQSEIVVPDTEYRGEDLTQELAHVSGSYRPTMILVPRKEDQHEDHCAAWFFLMDALSAVKGVDPSFTPDVVTYIIHWYSWPFDSDGPDLPPPPDLRGGVSGWIRVPLLGAEQKVKRAALASYRTQKHVFGWFLNGFARSNEIFSRPAPTRIVLPLRHNPCG